LVQTNGVLSRRMDVRSGVPDYGYAFEPEKRGMSDNVGTDGGEITMNQALNAPIMATRFGLATGRRRATVQPRGAHPEDVVDRFTDRRSGSAASG